MNKYFNSLVLLFHIALFNHTIVANPFEKLTPSITKGAENWANLVTTTLPDEMQLAFLNLFALSVEESSIPAFIKCAEYIETLPEMRIAYEQLGMNIMKKIKKYAELVHEKISRKKDLTEEQEETLWQKLEAKIQELIAYINKIYYQMLYGQVATKASSAPLYMFDENGIIPQEKRTKLLPQP